MKYVLDAVTILIPILCIVFGYRRGFLRSVVQLVGLFAAFLVAMHLSSALAPQVFDDFISQPLQETVISTIRESDTTSIEEQVQAVVDGLPEFLVNLLNADEAAKTALEQLSQQVDESAPVVAETLVVNVIRPLAVSLIHFILFILLFAVLMLVVKLLTVIIKPLTKLPVLHQVDGVLGGAIGVLKGVLFVLVAVTAMQLLFPQPLSETLLAKWIAENNPVAGILPF